MDYSLSICSLSSSSSLSLSSLSSSSDVEDLNYYRYARNTIRVNSDPSCSPLKRNPTLKNSKCFDDLRPGLAGILSDDGEPLAAMIKKDQKHFLDVCSLCNKRIGRNCDIFMYRGNTPFCSEECREEQIERDEADERIAKTSSSTTLSKIKKMTMSNVKKTTSSIDLTAAGTTVVVAG